MHIRIFIFSLLLLLRKYHKESCQDIWTCARYIWTKIFHGRALRHSTTKPSRYYYFCYFLVAQGIFLTLSKLLTHNNYIHLNIYFKKKSKFKFVSASSGTNDYFSFKLSFVHYIYMVDQNDVGFHNTIRFCPILDDA